MEQICSYYLKAKMLKVQNFHTKKVQNTRTHSARDKYIMYMISPC